MRMSSCVPEVVVTVVVVVVAMTVRIWQYWSCWRWWLWEGPGSHHTIINRFFLMYTRSCLRLAVRIATYSL